MKIGLLSFPRTPEEYILFAQENGFNHIEIDLFKHPVEVFTNERIKTIKEQAETHQINLSAHTPYTLNPAERFHPIQEAYKKYFMKAVEFTSLIGGGWLTIHPGYHIGFPGGKSKATTKACEFLRELLPHCEEHNILLALENVNPVPKDGELFYIGDSVNELMNIFQSLDSEYAVFCLDIGHAHTAEGVEYYVSSFKDILVDVHVHDNNGEWDEHLNVGEGTVEWEIVLRSLRQISYDGPLNLEIYDDQEKIESKNFIKVILES